MGQSITSEERLAQAIAHAALMDMGHLKLMAVVTNALIGDAEAMRAKVDKEVGKVGGKAWLKKVRAQAANPTIPPPPSPDFYKRRKLPSAQKGKPKGPNPNQTGYKGIKLKVYEALKQTSGSVSSIELAEVLDLKRVQVSGALNSLFEDKEVTREPSKVTNDSGKVSAVFLYKLKGG